MKTNKQTPSLLCNPSLANYKVAFDISMAISSPSFGSSLRVYMSSHPQKPPQNPPGISCQLHLAKKKKSTLTTDSGFIYFECAEFSHSCAMRTT